jgi:hypothetical protein
MRTKMSTLILGMQRSKFIMMHPQLLDGFNGESKGENNGRKKNWNKFPNSQHFGDRRAC